jgi:hypothetical protein
VWATQANVLSKTWLTSLRDLVELASNVKEGQSARVGPVPPELRDPLRARLGHPAVHRPRRWASTGSLRVHRGLLKQSFGSAKLPVKRDGLLGRPVPVESGDRLFGLKAGPGASDATIRSSRSSTG